MKVKPIMFVIFSCQVCLAQVKILSDKFGDTNANITYYDLKRYPPPNFIQDRSGNYSMPTWLLPDKSGNYKMHKGIINKQLEQLIEPKKIKKNKRKLTHFGESNISPRIDTLAVYGKNFDDYQGFKVPNSFLNDMRDKWGPGDDVLVAGTIGKDLGPGNTDKLYSENYFSGIRMGGPPAGDYGTLLFNNRQANIVNNQSTAQLTPGLIYDTPNTPQVVGFGKKRRSKNNFGELSMGPSYGSQYIMGPNTLKNIGAGGLQNNNPKMTYVDNKDIWIGSNTPPAYNPIGDVSKFGKQRKFKKPGPGSTLIIKNNKIKVR